MITEELAASTAGTTPLRKPTNSETARPRRAILQGTKNTGKKTGGVLGHIDEVAKRLAAQRSKGAAQARDQDGLGQDQEQHPALAEADRLQDGDLRRPLAHRHRHGVAGDEEERDHHRHADAVDGVLEVTQHVREHLAERFLGLGAGRKLAVAIQIVDFLAQRGHDVGVLALDEDHAGVARDPGAVGGKRAAGRELMVTFFKASSRYS